LDQSAGGNINSINGNNENSNQEELKFDYNTLPKGMTQENSRELGNANFELSVLQADQEINTLGMEEKNGPINIEESNISSPEVFAQG